MFCSTYEIEKLQVVKETEKAFGLKGWCNYIGKTKSWEIVVWVPKSICANGTIPAWFVNKKREEYDIDDKEVVLELK